MTTIERPYLYIKPPDMEEAGRYLLIAARPAFGTTIGTPVMVKLDYIKHFGMGESAWIEGYTELNNELEKGKIKLSLNLILKIQKHPKMMILIELTKNIFLF